MKVSRYLLLALLLFQGGVGLYLSLSFLTNPAPIFQKVIQEPYSDVMQFPAMLMGCQTLVIAIVALIGSLCLWKDHKLGVQIGLLLGAYSILVGLFPGLLLGRMDVLYIDGGRGLLMVTTALILFARVREAEVGISQTA